MSRKKKIWIIIEIISWILLVGGVICLIFGILALDEKKDIARPLILIGTLGAVFGAIPLVIYVTALIGSSLSSTLDIAFNKDKLNSAYLHVYASKNSRFYYNYLPPSKHDKNPHIRFNQILFGTSTKYLNVDVYDSKYIDEKIDEAYGNVNILDARKINDVLFLEVELDSYNAYIYIGMNIKKYEILLLNKEDLKKRDEINNKKYNWFTINVKIKDSFKTFFKSIEEDKRDIKKDIDDNKKLEDVILEIKETLINGG
ncbi:MAG: hypothetical protein J6Y28_02750 [Acholeplasmatales bacterium]|nr:hypothetical protein [Acholeplasmatales bacterium]